MTRVAVIGGGITGLAAAWELSKHDGYEITVYEAASDFGGKLQTNTFHGKQVDTGADAFLARVPEAVALCEELGITTELVAPATSNAMIWSRNQLHPFPKTTVLGIPSDIDDLARTGIISEAGIARARAEVDLPEPVGRGDVTIGELVAARFGDEIKDRLVNPLVGNINAGDIDQLSLASANPQIADLAKRNASLTVAAREQLAVSSHGATPRPVFYSPAQGMYRLIAALVDQLTARNVHLLLDTPVQNLNDLDADAFVIATPAFTAAELVHNAAPRAADALAQIRYASVAILRFAYSPKAVGIPVDASGFVIPSIENTLLTACSWASSKWSALADAETFMLRASVGRIDDERAVTMTDTDLIAAAHIELANMMEINSLPISADVTRWANAFPQYERAHDQRIRTIENSMSDASNVVLAGAAYEGIGVPACIRSGKRAAARLISTFGPESA